MCGYHTEGNGKAKMCKLSGACCCHDNRKHHVTSGRPINPDHTQTLWQACHQCSSCCTVSLWLPTCWRGSTGCILQPSATHNSILIFITTLLRITSDVINNVRKQQLTNYKPLQHTSNHLAVQNITLLLMGQYSMLRTFQCTNGVPIVTVF